MLKLKLPLMGLCVSGVIATAFVCPTASACGGAWIPEVDEVDYRPHGVSEAERKLEAGKVAAAAGNVIRVMPHIKQLSFKSPASLVGRAQRVLAVTIARTGGALPVAREIPDYVYDTWLGKTAAERHANLEWSVSALRKLNELKSSDPSVESQLAEALSQLDEHRTEAKEILERLAKSDLLGSPEAYAALARLRATAGDNKGYELALRRCEAMSAGKARCETGTAG